MDEATFFKFGKWIDTASPTPGVTPPPKGAWYGSRHRFWNFKPPSIFFEWMRLRCLNLESGSSTEVPPTRKNPPERGMV